MRCLIVCVILVAGCGVVVQPVPSAGKLTTDERERWEKVRVKVKEDIALFKTSLDAADKKSVDESIYAVVYLDTDGWDFVKKTPFATKSKFDVINVGRSGRLRKLSDAKESASEAVKDPKIDCAAVVNLLEKADPEPVYFTRDRASDKTSLAAYLLSVQKDAGR